MRFDKTIRLFGSVLFTIAVIVWLPIVIYVPALAFNQVTGVNIHIVTPVVCIVCIFYTCVGGLKAVVWTDVVQSFVMVGSLLMVIIKGTYDVGGVSEVFRRNYESGRIEAPEFSFNPSIRLSIWSIFIGGTFFWTQAISCNQVMTQRFLALPSFIAAKKALVAFTFGICFIHSCCMYNGLLIFATYHKCDPLTTKLAKANDQLVPLLVMDILSEWPGFPGLFVAGVFSAALSSLSTGLNSLSAIFLEDFLKPYIKRPLTEKQTALFLRTVVVVIGIISILLVFVVEKLGMVLQLSMTLGSITNGPLFGIFVMGLLMPWINARSALAGGLTGFSIMGYICIKAQISISTGELIFPTKPVSVEECTYSYDNSSLKPENTVPTEQPDFAIHHISFLYYIIVGASISIIGGNLASLVFGRSELDEVDPSLFAPCVRRFLQPRHYLSVEFDHKTGETTKMNIIDDIKDPAIRSNILVN